MGFKQRERKRKKKAATDIAQLRSRETRSSVGLWWLTPLTQTGSCAERGQVLRAGRAEGVYRHEPRELLVRRSTQHLLSALGSMGACAEGSEGGVSGLVTPEHLAGLIADRINLERLADTLAVRLNAEQEVSEWITPAEAERRYGHKAAWWRKRADEYGARDGDGPQAADHAERCPNRASPQPAQGRVIGADARRSARMSAPTDGVDSLVGMNVQTSPRAPLLKPVDAARLANVSLSTIRREIDRGELRPPTLAVK